MNTVGISITVLAFLQSVLSNAPKNNQTQPDNITTNGSRVSGKESFYLPDSYRPIILYYLLVVLAKLLAFKFLT
jgi:hypothetical protein